MKKSVIAAFVFLIGGVAQGAAFQGYLVKVASPRVTEDLISILNRSGADVQGSIPELDLLVTRHRPQGLSARESGLIRYVEPNYLVSRQDLPAPAAGREGNWGIQAVNADYAWAITRGSPEIIVGVSDTGIMQSHWDLKPGIWMNAGENGKDPAGKDRAKNKLDDDQNGYVDDSWGWNFGRDSNFPFDDHAHGTHVSGIIGSRGEGMSWAKGVAPATSLMALKFLDSAGQGTTEGGIRTLIYGATHGAKVINCSWGGDGFTQSLYDAIEFAKARGVLVVAAAGNDGISNDATPFYPASYENENLISVAATTDAKHKLAYFSNYGAKSVDLAAPGDYIMSTILPNFNSLEPKWYAALSGTSMAAPFVSGTIALMYAANPTLSWMEVKEVLLRTVSPSTHLKGKVASGGALNALEAVKAVSASQKE
jgi:subtilisin family serine protease